MRLSIIFSFSIIFLLLSSACSKPINYGYEPDGSREFWNERSTQLITHLPGLGERGVSVTGPLRITFSKTVLFTDQKHITLYPISNRSARIRCRIVPYGDGRTFTLYPKIPFLYNKTYMWKISGVMDLNHVPVPDFSGNFHTEVFKRHLVYQKGGMW